MEGSASFPKTHRLKRKKIIDDLFKAGKKEFKHPIMAVWQLTELPENVPVQAGFTVSKKFLKRAVDRNLVKRRMLEAYRKQQVVLSEKLIEKNQQLAVFFITVKTDNISYDHIQHKMLLTLQSIAQKIADDK